MASKKPLDGVILIDCAKANAKQGLAVAAKQCGFGDDTERFMQVLKQACEDMGIELNQIEDLITEQQRVKQQGGFEVAPETPADL
ncbi:MAG: hypothetical protein HC886_18805 [Leptolyngbyaceae cyanobacterium SM1_1_3]|nr:hypothetical protein [Leptolyngbyaceae cyanobacterium SM1_1_3]NJN04270.1 hypothetical protein [Leptolyngbyaceae cyanobacterium RM1_1_2]NJO11613.1 hypothetical protein [Leptolyngbyaceae cyanobacterium SL_1_1]